MPSSRSFSAKVLAFALLSFSAASLQAQITTISDTTSTPTPGAGHDYIHLLSETVNPANGSVSLRIAVPMPKGRGISIPFAFGYDSNGISHPVPSTPGRAFWVSNSDSFAQGGWSYVYPSLRIDAIAFNLPILTGENNGQPIYTIYPCDSWTNYLFMDGMGGMHSLGLGAQDENSPPPGGCPGTPGPSGANGDPDVYGTLVPVNGGNFQPLPVTVYDKAGTVYYFSSLPGTSFPTTTTSSGAPTYIEDRNGNKITATQNGNSSIAFTDTLGRAVLTMSGFGPSGATNTVTAGGLTYQVTWKTLSPSYTLPANNIQNFGGSCYWAGGPSANYVVVSKITLPSGQFYQFYYSDNPNPSFQNPYGLLSEIDYPDGGSVKYTWKLSDTYNELADYPGGEANGQGGLNPVTDGCLYQYKTPVIASREVFYGGSNPALTQSFTYGTVWSSSAPATWTTKTTTQSSTDNITGLTTQTNYCYTPAYMPVQPFESTNYPAQVPQESVTAYGATGQPSCSVSSSALRTTVKTWYDTYDPASQQTYLEDGTTSSKIVYCYAGSNCVPPATLSQLIEKDEWDVGASMATRKTFTTYQNFSHTPGVIADRPCKVVVQDGLANTFAETDYYYDGNTGLCSTVSSGVATGGPSGFSSHDGTTFSTTATTPRGNATKVVRKCLQSCTDATTTYTFDEAGNVLSLKDPRGNTTTYSYVDNFDTPPAQSTYAYLTQITDPLAHVSKFKYALSDGQLISSTNQNSQTTSYVYNDSLRRLTEADHPDGGKTTIAYNDTAPSPSVVTSHLVTTSPSVSVSTTAVMDGLGHVTQTQLTTDPDGITYTDTTYDGFGRVRTQSNPYRSKTEATYGVTTNYFDTISRPCVVVPPDGSLPSGNGCPSTQPSNTIFTTYSLNTTTVTDQAGRSRKSVTDALGRLMQVFEDPANLNYETDYQYDVLDNLLCVAQKGNNSGTFTNCASTPASWRRRTFAYNSLSQLTQAVNPESGTIAYLYDANGNLSTKTSPKPNQTGTATVMATYSYDALDRITQKSFNDGTTPTVKYGYDAVALTGCATTPPTLTDSNPIGTRTAMCDGAGAESWSHDSMGRVLGDQRTTNGVTYGFPQTYNLDGSVNTLNYGNYSGSDVVTFLPGGAGRPVSETGTINSWTIVSAAHYAPNGALCGLSYYGVGAAENISFNNRFQPLHWHVTSTPWGGNPAPPPCQPPSWTAGWLDYVYNYVDSNGHNNGNVQSIFNNVSKYWSQNFTYDSLNRIATAQTNGTISNGAGNCWAETYSIDPWGNLYQFGINTTTQSAYVGCFQESGLTTQANTNNQLVNYGYDAAGNMISVPGIASYSYDAENHLISTAGYTYSYDGDGRRVMKSSGSSGTIYWYGASSMPLFETSLTGGGNFAYYYFNGRITNRREFAHYFTPDLYVHDALGNTNLASTTFPDGWDYSDYYPFGGEWVHQSVVGNHYKFTGKERDSESGLDNFGARYDSSSMGRFMSPDPLGGLLLDPQTLNKYSYVRNNPINLTDPTGLYICRDDPKDGSSHCSSDNDKRFEEARQHDLQSKNADVVNAARAYGDQNSANGVTVGFADLGKNSEGGVTVSTLGADDKANLFAKSDVTINSSSRGTALDADVGHEGSHVEDAQKMAASITFDKAQNIKVGDDISAYRSEQRAYAITDTIYRSANESYHGCASDQCALGAGSSPLGIPGRIDQILLANPKVYHSSDGKPLTPSNQGGNVLNLTIPH